MIELRGVTKRFGSNVVLEDLDLEVERGELMAILGSSGAGKSLTMRLMAGLMHPDRGEVRIDGKRLSGRSREELREERPTMGVVFQHDALFDGMAAIQNVAFPLRMGTDWPPERIRRRALECLDEVGLRDAADRQPAQLSGGERTRVALARAIVTEPDYLLYDEPLRGLDPKSVESTARVIDRISREREVTAVLVTHAVHVAVELADRMAFLHDGSVRFLGTPSELEESEDPVVEEWIRPALWQREGRWKGHETGRRDE